MKLVPSNRAKASHTDHVGPEGSGLTVWGILFMKKSLYGEKKKSFLFHILVLPHKSWMDEKLCWGLFDWGFLIKYTWDEKKEEGFVSVHQVRLPSSLRTAVLPIIWIPCLSLQYKFLNLPATIFYTIIVPVIETASILTLNNPLFSTG